MPLDSGIAQAAELGGFFAAHSLWCVSDGETLIPLVGHEGKDGKRNLTRLVTEDLDEGVEQGKAMLVANPDKAQRAVLVFDGFLTLGEVRKDALFVTFVDYTAKARVSVELAVPYRSKEDKAGFAVHRPKFIELGRIEDLAALSEAFFRGVEAHEEGSKVWTKFLDQSF